MPDAPPKPRPFFLYHRLHTDSKWTGTAFADEAGARARIKTVEGKPCFWILYRNQGGTSTVVDQSTPKK